MMDIPGYIVLLNRNTNNLLELLKEKDDLALAGGDTGKWNVLQILEHLLLAENLVFKIVTRPSEKLAERKEIKGSDHLERLLVDLRSRKAKAPAVLEPKGEIKNLEDFRREFQRLRTRLAIELETGLIVVDERVHTHPLLGEMTISDWLHFLISHARRHMEQIKEIIDEIKPDEKSYYGA